MTRCTVGDCGSPSRWRGMCKKHSLRWWRTGDPLVTPRFNHEARFLASFVAAAPAECWHWRGTVNGRGYGVFKADGVARGAHIVSYEKHIGPVPPGLVVGHVCHDRDPICPGGTPCLHRRCVNPAHLQAMTHAENIRAGRCDRIKEPA